MTSSVHRPIGGFNLLPWRSREVRRLRRRIALEWLGAALLGCACAAPFAGWLAWQRSGFEQEHRTLEMALVKLRPSLVEERRLVRDADERRSRIAAAEQRAIPLARLLRLLDELASLRVEGVALRQVVHRAHETELHAAVSGEAATAAWLARLRALPEVAAVSVREMKRDERQQGSLQVIAQLAWAGAVAGDAHAASAPVADERRARSGG